MSKKGVAPLYIPPHTNCQNCGDCCGMIPASPKEVEQIKDFLSKHPMEREKAQAQSHRPFDCPFRDAEQRKCLVYPVRPMVCRLMGVCAGMECKHGNSAFIDGRPFLRAHDLNNVLILNNLDWRQ